MGDLLMSELAKKNHHIAEFLKTIAILRWTIPVILRGNMMKSYPKTNLMTS